MNVSNCSVFVSNNFSFSVFNKKFKKKEKFFKHFMSSYRCPHVERVEKTTAIIAYILDFRLLYYFYSTFNSDTSSDTYYIRNKKFQQTYTEK